MAMRKENKGWNKDGMCLGLMPSRIFMLSRGDLCFPAFHRQNAPSLTNEIRV
jgi:hypothetical protein